MKDPSKVDPIVFNGSLTKRISCILRHWGFELSDSEGDLTSKDSRKSSQDVHIAAWQVVQPWFLGGLSGHKEGKEVEMRRMMGCFF